MTEDVRCCGTGTCIINDEGLCWCGQQWDGEKMCFPKPTQAARSEGQTGHDALSAGADDPAQ
jgi:hypothetical protein